MDMRASRVFHFLLRFNMSISLIAAISQNNCIGKNNDLPWHIPEDMKRVKEFTTGKVLIMGRKTWESIPEKFRPLPNRTNVIITRNAGYVAPQDVEVYDSVEKAIAAHEGEEIVSFGGTSIFARMLPLADRLEITHVHQTVDGCTAFFPEIKKEEWKEISREDKENYSFVSYIRI